MDRMQSADLNQIFTTKNIKGKGKRDEMKDHCVSGSTVLRFTGCHIE